MSATGLILVVGGTGFVGGAIVRELTRRGKDVAVLTRDRTRAEARSNGSVEYREGDVRDPSTLALAMTDVKVVIGSQQFPGSPMENPGKGHTFEEIDAIGTERLVEAAHAAEVERYVYLSGAGAARDAKYHWFRAKWRAEEAVRKSGMTYVILRPSWIYGPEDVSLNRFMKMSRFLPFVPLIGSAATQQLQPVFIDDVAKIAAECVDTAATDNREFEIGGPDALSMTEIVRTALEVTGRRRFLLSTPAPVMKAVATVARHLPGPPLTPDAIDFIAGDAVCDPTVVQEVLGVKVRPLREALSTYLTSG